MRLMTWNCRVGAFKRKAARIASFAPDVFVVPEAERLDEELFLDGERQPSFLDRVAEPNWPRGIAVGSYTGVELSRAFDANSSTPGFAPFSATSGTLRFQVIAVWTFKTSSALTSYRQAHQGLQRWATWIRQKPTVIMGDFNLAANYQGGKAWRELIDLIAPLGLVSAYHAIHGVAPGAEAHPTYFHGGSDSSTWHIDYCFIPTEWVSSVKVVDVGAHDDWRDVSDHMPLTVDLDANGIAHRFPQANDEMPGSDIATS